MFKKLVLAGLTSALLMVPVVSSADVISDLQAQITALLAQLRAIQQQMGGSGGQLPPICGVSRVLAQNDTGPDVSTLQSFLQTQGFASQDPTGVFASGTKAALVAFQVQTGIAALAGGSGIYGPFTRSYIASHFCITLPNPSPNPSPSPAPWRGTVTLSATPSGGSAPLPVQFNISGNGSYRINFGDQNASATVTTIAGYISAFHTYSNPGNYTVTVFPILSCTSQSCTQSPAAATVNIVVSANNPGISISAPASGANFVQGQSAAVTWSVQNPPADATLQLWLMDTRGNNWGIVQNVYGDALRYSGSTDRNAGISGNLASGNFAWHVPGSNCDANGQNCHFATDGCGPYFTYAGSYYILGKLYQGSQTYGTTGCYNAPSYLGTAAGSTFTISSSTPATNANLNITGLTAPSALTTGQSGAWTLNANVPTGTTQVSYLVAWGDGAVGTTASAQSTSITGTSSVAVFTHTYANAATYAPVFTVAAGGAAASTSASVVVSGTSTTPPPGNTGSLTASPLSGTTPLVVHFRSTVAADYIDFGDGTVLAAGSGGYCSTLQIRAGCLISLDHTYGRPGTFAVKLYGEGCGTAASCIIGTATINVYDPGTLGGGANYPSNASCYYGGNYYNNGQQQVLSTLQTGSGTYQCQNGTWVCMGSSDAGGSYGGTCVLGARFSSAAPAQNTNLASALTALEAALSAILAKLGR